MYMMMLPLKRIRLLLMTLTYENLYICTHIYKTIYVQMAPNETTEHT